MDKRRILTFSVAVLFVLCVTADTARAGIFSDDEQNWEKIFVEIKKINSRLVALETDRFKALQVAQENLLRQLGEIRQVIPDLQGAVELSKSEMVGYISKANSKLMDLEAHMQNEMATALERQKQGLDKMSTDVDASFNRLTGELAKDMESFSKTNKDYFHDFSLGNKEALDKIVTGLNQQNQSLVATNNIIRTEMITAIAEINKSTQQSLKANGDAMTAGLSLIDEKNKKLVAILSQSFLEAQETRAQVGLIAKNLETTNSNVKLTHENTVKLGEVLSARLDALSAAQQKMEVGVAENSKAIREGFRVTGLGVKNAELAVQGASESLHTLNGQSELLLASTKAIATHAEQLDQEFARSLEKLEANHQQADLANQKLAKLIEILKAMALEQSKVDQVLQSQKELEGAQGKIRQSLDELKGGQTQAQEALADLRRKANVNISKNEDIHKALEKSAPAKPKPSTDKPAKK